MIPTYKVSECFVLHFDAGTDPDHGTRRRVYALGDCRTGRILAAAPNESADAEQGLLDLISGFVVSEPYVVAKALKAKVGERIRVAPSHRTHLLRREAQERSGNRAGAALEL